MVKAHDAQQMINVISKHFGFTPSPNSSTPFSASGEVINGKGANPFVGVYGRIIDGTLDWEVNVAGCWLSLHNHSTENAQEIINSIKQATL